MRQYLSWAEFKAKMEAAGVTDADLIAYIDFRWGTDPVVTIQDKEAGREVLVMDKAMLP